jgi:hypothetical protein
VGRSMGLRRVLRWCRRKLSDMRMYELAKSNARFRRQDLSCLHGIHGVEDVLLSRLSDTTFWCCVVCIVSSIYYCNRTS